MNKECNHQWSEVRKVTVFDNCSDSCPKEIPNDHGHMGRIGILAVCIQCDAQKIVGEDNTKINALNLV